MENQVGRISSILALIAAVIGIITGVRTCINTNRSDAFLNVESKKENDDTCIFNTVCMKS